MFNKCGHLRNDDFIYYINVDETLKPNQILFIGLEPIPKKSKF
jgi:hypothetical protein